MRRNTSDFHARDFTKARHSGGSASARNYGGERQGVPAWIRWLAPDATIDPAAVSQTDWATTLAEVSSHHLTATLYSRLLANGCVGAVEESARQTLAEAHQRAGWEALAWQRALRLVLPELAAKNVVAAPYKGAALAFMTYGSPAERSMSDLDLWIDAADMSEACLAMESLGFVRRENPERPLALQARYDGEVPYSGRAVGVPLVELHWGVFPGEWLRLGAAIDRDGVRSRRRTTTLFGTPVLTLSPEDHFIQIAVHAAVTHVFSQTALRSLLDLVTLACRGLDLPTVIARAREWRLAGVIGLTLQITGELFGQTEFVAAAGELISPVRLRELTRFANPATILRHKKPSVLHTLRYLLVAMDYRRDRYRLVAHGAWPDQDWLRARYGRAGLGVRARHLAAAVRGRF